MAAGHGQLKIWRRSVKRVASNITLLKWILPKTRKKEETIEAYILRYCIPNEDATFYIERAAGNGVRRKFLIVPREIRNRVKGHRFKFYQVLEKFNIINTDLGRLVSAEDIAELRKELNTWLKEWNEIQREIDEFIRDPSNYRDWVFIREIIRKFNLSWPPKDFNLAGRVWVEFLGPIKIPGHIYNRLVEKALTNVEPQNKEEK